MRARFEPRGTKLSCRTIPMGLDQGPSWQQRDWPAEQNVVLLSYLLSAVAAALLIPELSKYVSARKPDS